eukprot:scaffold16330_cov172-Amphora_coffeaeformis.AAC.19
MRWIIALIHVGVLATLSLLLFRVRLLLAGAVIIQRSVLSKLCTFERCSQKGQHGFLVKQQKKLSIEFIN